MSQVRQCVGLSVLLTIVLCAANAWPQGDDPLLPKGAQPALVRFQGKLLSPDGRAASGFDSLNVFVNEQKYLFQIEQMKTLSGPNLTMMQLTNLFPPRLRFIGPERLLKAVQEEARAGQAITVEGRLFVAEGNYLLTAVGEAAEKIE